MLRTFKIIAFFLIIIINNVSCQEKEQTVGSIDFEKLNSDSTSFISENGALIKSNKNLVLSDSYSGNNSIRLNSRKSFKLEKVTINSQEAIKVSIWRKGGSLAYLVLKIGDNDILNAVKKSIIKEKDGWEKLSYIFRLPPFEIKSEVHISVYNHGKETVLFDDYSSSVVENELPNSLLSDAIYLYVEKKSEEKLSKYRKSAIENKTIIQSSKKWVKAFYVSKGDTFKVNLRFKGDWLDHIKGNKWSMRIKIKEDKYWHGFRTFSIQNPDSKSIFDEYAYHELLRDNDILSPRYGFVPVYINENFAGVFSYEEHFEKQLEESMKRREGPILKLDEEPFWAVNTYNENNKGKLKTLFYKTSKVVPFGSKRVRGNRALLNNYLNAQDLVYTLKNSEKVENVIDIEKFAAFYALVDLSGAYHSLIWHNLRFYYNPVSHLIEPVVFDGFTENGIYDWTKGRIIANCCNSNVGSDNYLIKKLFKNKEFYKAYMQFLKKYNNHEYLTDFFKSKMNQINKYEELLDVDYPDIKYEFNYLKTRVDKNTREIQEIDTSKFKTINEVSKKLDTEYELSVSKEFLNIYPTSDSLKYTIENFNPFDLTVVAYGRKKKEKIIISSISILPYKNNKFGEYTLETKQRIKYIYITDRQRKDTARIRVNKFIKPKLYSSPKTIIDKQEVFEDFITINDKIITFKSGTFEVDNPIIIPRGYRLIIKEGVQLDFVKESFLLSYAPMIIEGTQKKPVVFYSSDRTAKGITIIKAKEDSEIKYLKINGFDTHSYNGWKLTGALTFFESNVSISNLSIENNICEDALNIVSSHFKIEDSKFENIYSDAFDADFSDGEINNCTFKNIKNDAIDFSGSKAKVVDCKIDKIGDKAVSAGEQSTLEVENTSVSNVNIAFASKDKSVLTVTNSNINTANIALASYIKKNEFGASELFINQTKLLKIKQTLLIDKNCEITIDGKNLIGEENIDVDKLYEIFKK